jgi:cytochrome c-type biogenesis protein CcmH
MRTLSVLLLVLALVAPPAAATAAEPRASLPDIEDEVMCLECGTALNVSNSAVADQEREFIAGLIAQGMTKAEIKDALVAEYGPRVLAEPGDDGLALVVLIARSWRGRGGAAPADVAAAGPGLDEDDARRLDEELAAFDR